MSLYGNYLKEREGFDIVESSNGFATFQCNKDECYLRDIYVIPQARKSGEASRLADQVSVIAKERGCKYLVGSVAPNANGSTESIKVLLSYGFRLARSTNEIIFFSKQI